MTSKLINIFKESLNLDFGVEVTELEFNSIPEWDSIGHMTLIASIEDVYNISFETDDIVDFSSFNKGKFLLESKYGVKFD